MFHLNTDDRLLGDQVAAFVQSHAPARERSERVWTVFGALVVAPAVVALAHGLLDVLEFAFAALVLTVGRVVLAALGPLARDSLARAAQRLLRVGLAAAAL